MEPSEDSGKYLEDGFDANTLKVSTLRNLLVKHKVEYPSNAKKPELLEIFDKKITRKAGKLRKESSRAKKVKADGRGIQVVKEDEIPESKTKTKNKGRNNKNRMAKFQENDSAGQKTSGVKRKLEDVVETSEEAKSESKKEGKAVAAGQKKRVINAANKDINDMSSGDSDRSTEASNAGQQDKQQQQPRKKKKKVATMGSPTLDRESNFSSDNPFQSGSRPATPDRRKRKAATQAGGAKSPMTPMSALRKSQVSEVSFRVALPKTASESGDVEMQEPGEEAAEPEQEPEVEPKKAVGAEPQATEESEPVVEAEPEKLPEPAVITRKISHAGPPRFVLAAVDSQQAFEPAVHSPQRFSMTPDGLRQLAAAQGDNQQRLEQLFPPAASPVTLLRPTRRAPSSSELPPVAPSIPVASTSADVDEIQTLQRRRVATLRQHVESETRGQHSRRSSIASIADSVGEARGIPAVPASAVAETRGSTKPQRNHVPKRTSFMRRLALCALLGMAAFGWRTHEQFRTGFGNTRAGEAHLPAPAGHPLVEPSAVDFATAPMADRVRYLLQVARARYVQPRALGCPEHATCVPYVGIPAEAAAQEALDVAARDQWVVNADGQDVAVVKCDSGHVVRFPGLSSWAVPMVPECVRDLSTAHRVRQLADAMASVCGERRGQAQCEQSLYELARECLSRVPEPSSKEAADEADEVERLGVSVTELRQLMEARRAPHLSAEEFDTVFRLAVDELMNKSDDVAGFVLEFEDDEGAETSETTYLVSRKPSYPVLCRLRRLALGVLLGHVRGVLASVGLGVVFMVGWRRYLGYRAEIRAADTLVLSAFDRLKRQARRHYVDPALSPSPAIPSLQLRDLLLLSSGSSASTPVDSETGGPVGYYDPRARASVWERVRCVVERNANVRCRTTAVRGEPMRVWEWIGPLDDDADEEPAPFASPFSSPQRLSSPYPSNIVPL
ncbi:hypothetical protein H4R99_001545 [Coemansia sp. RSA 1722]|nr:hypothetical protein LPJ57_000671 [Coemansia sp. RSA 486]KAJ2238015.1 hypothetical protein IWW45_000490 [Coemansia sp. RSA 485]KAJ2604861.1 hypothetical protein H4R99_001545 [Coemansia sp. RSA 1722]